MRTYKTSPQSFAKIRRDIIQGLSIISGLVFGSIIGWDIWQNRNNNESDFSYLILVLIIIVATTIFSIRKAVLQQQQIWNSIEIKLDDDYISRQQIRIPEVKIYRSEITEIEEHKHGLIVKTVDKGRLLAIPIQLDRADYLEIKDTLKNWQGSEILAAKTNRRDIALAIAYLVAFLLLFLSFNIWAQLYFRHCYFGLHNLYK